MVQLQFGFFTATSSAPTKYLSTVNHNLAPGRYRVKVFEVLINNTSTGGTASLFRLDFLSGITRERHTFLPTADTSNSTVVDSYVTALYPFGVLTTSLSPTVYLPPSSILIPNIFNGNREGFEFDAILTGNEIKIQLLLGYEKWMTVTTASSRIQFALIGLELAPI